MSSDSKREATKTLQRRRYNEQAAALKHPQAEQIRKTHRREQDEWKRLRAWSRSEAES